MGPTPTQRRMRRRRALALLIAAAATASIWAAFVRGGTSGGTSGAPPAGVSAPVAALARGLTLDQLVDQVLLLGFDGTDASSPIFAQLRLHQIGGVFVGSRNWNDAQQGATLIADLRATGLAGGRIPPLIVARQGGGASRSFADLPPFATELQIGASGSPAAVEGWARQAAAAMRDVGIDLDIFPSADVTPTGTAMANDSFSGDPVTAAQLTAAALRGCADAQMACAPEHFPGLGAASQDTDQGPATVSLDATTLGEHDLPAFKAAFSEGAPAVVLSLAYYAAYDPVTPGALSSAIDTGLLRNRLGYTGAAITDDLGAGAITATSSVPQAAVQAIQAGADLVQIDSPGEQAGVRDALVHAVQTGVIPVDRLREAAGRVLQLKRRIGLLKGQL